MRKIILIGQAPGKRSKEPLDGASGRRLASLAGLDLADFLNRFERVNLLDEWPGGGPHKGDRFDLAAARERADQLRERWAGRKAVLLGKGVMAAFRLLPEDAEWFQPVEVHPGLEVACMPHPSGISQWWNDPANVERAREFMLRLKLDSVDRDKRRREKFTVEQVAAALEAGRGVFSWAAEALAESTGHNCVPQTIRNYVDRYPELGEVGRTAQVLFMGRAVKNVVKAIEAGDVDTSKWALTTKMAHDAADALGGVKFERVISAKVNGQIDHRHAHLHAQLNGSGLDLDRYSPEQLRAIEDFAGAMGGLQDPGRLHGARPAAGGPARVGPEGEG